MSSFQNFTIKIFLLLLGPHFVICALARPIIKNFTSSIVCLQNQLQSFRLYPNIFHAGEDEDDGLNLVFAVVSSGCILIVMRSLAWCVGQCIWSHQMHVKIISVEK